MRSEKNKTDVEALEESEEEKYVPSVSFDTVPLLAGIACECSDDNHDDHMLEYTEDEFYDNEAPTDNYGHLGYLSEYDLIDSKIDGLDGFHIGRDGRITRTDYPTRPTIVNDALVLNKAHKAWLTLWRQRKASIDSRLRSPSAHFVFPDFVVPAESNPKITSASGYSPLTKEQRRRALIISKKVGFPNSPRTIVCHISGRKYTWTALDWLLKRFSKDVDHLVIIANIPKMSNNRSRSRSRSRSAVRRSRSAAPSRPHSGNFETMHRTFSAGPTDEQNRQQHDEWLEWASGYDAGRIKEVLKNILDYVMCILPENRAVKITVEIIIGKTKHILVDSINVYFPDLMVLSSVRSGETESMVKWKSRSLIDKACQTFPVPIVLVPVKKLLDLESTVRDDLDEQIKTKANENSAQMPPLQHSNTAPGVLDHIGTSDHSVTGSSASETAESSPLENDVSAVSSVSSSLKNNATTADSQLKDDLVALRRKTKSRILDLENDNSLSVDKRLVSGFDEILNSTLKFADLLDALNQSTESLVELKKVFTGEAKNQTPRSNRSMLDVVDSPKASSSRQHKRRTPVKAKFQLPSAQASHPGSAANTANTSIPKVQIQFAPEVKGKDGSNMSGRDEIERTLSYDATLRPHSSHGIEGALRETDLRKVRSASVLKPTKSATMGQDIKKMSKGFFFLFGGSDSGANSGSGSLASTPSSSRRNSSGSEVTGLTLNTPKKKRRSRFFGLRK
ncbi:LAFA_0E13366g1_1 [Lachancea sp. 'fantastica']|nr:LAFA_0E13366g1_1 [Lachancea sp. 'fantastica']